MERDKKWLRKELANAMTLASYFKGDDWVLSSRKVHLLIDEMDEVPAPQKPTVPTFVAKWFRENDSISWWRKIVEWESGKELENEEKEVCQWFVDGNEDDFILAWITGEYEIEKEKLYRVIVAVEKGMFFKYAYINSNGNINYGLEIEDADKLTEAQINAIDSRYMAFAVPVE